MSLKELKTTLKLRTVRLVPYCGALLMTAALTCAANAQLTVTNTNNSGSGSLRKAINDAKDETSPVTINITVSGTIYVTGNQLPPIEKSVVINATSGPVVIDGSSLGASQSGLRSSQPQVMGAR